MPQHARHEERHAAAEAAHALLAAIGDPARPAIDAGRVGVIVAHPDDETLGCGGQLARLYGVQVAIVTDGAPRRGRAAAEHGHRGAASYAMARRRELAAALALAGLAPDQVVLLGLPDQEVAEQMPVLARRLAAMCRTRGIDVVITHAMEGGHPDHDAVAFAVRAAAALADRDGYPIAVLEMPFYRRGPSGWLHQSFVPDRRSPATDVRLSDDEIALKRSMLAAHASQRATLAQFPVHVERFRPATPIDVTILPNDGALLYELYDWGLTGERWLALTGLACRTLGLGPVL